MSNKYFDVAARTTLNLITLGTLTAVTIFAFNVLKASGEKAVDTITADINEIRSKTA